MTQALETLISTVVSVVLLVGLIAIARRMQRQRSTRPIAQMPAPGTPRPITPVARIPWWQRRRVRSVALYAALVGTFLCWWQAASEHYGAVTFTDAQWRLLGWTCLATAGAIAWQQHKERLTH